MGQIRRCLILSALGMRGLRYRLRRRVCDVMLLRGLRMAQGGAKAEAEVQRMITEKVAALTEAQVAAICDLGHRNNCRGSSRQVLLPHLLTQSGHRLVDFAVAHNGFK